MASSHPHNNPRLGDLAADGGFERHKTKDVARPHKVLGSGDLAPRYLELERSGSDFPQEQPGEPARIDDVFPNGPYSEGSDLPDQVPPPMEHDPEVPPPEWPHPEDEPEEQRCICHLECRPPWWQGTHVLPDDKTRCNLWADREPDQGNLVELWFHLSSKSTFPEDEVVITVSDPSAVALLKMNTQHRPAAEDFQRGVPEIRDRIPCPGGYTCFATGLKATPDPVTVTARWGTLVCPVTLDVKDWQCSCEAYCVTVDKNWNLERVDECNLELAEPDPNADPPVEATDVVAPIVVSFEGPSDRRIEWHAKSVNGYVECVGNRDAPGFASGELNCGDLDVFLVKPTALAEAELSVGATTVTDTIVVTSGLGDCASIPIQVSAPGISLRRQGDDTATPFMLLSETIKSDPKAAPCDKFTRSDCEDGFSGRKFFPNLPKKDQKIIDMWKHGCLSEVIAQTMLSLCEVGWYFDASLYTKSDNRGYSSEGELSAWDPPTGVFVEGKDFQIDFFNRMVSIYGYAFDSDKCEVMTRALRALTFYLSSRNSNWVQYKAIKEALSAGDQRHCKNLEKARKAVSRLNVAYRHWRILYTIGGTKLKDLWSYIRDTTQDPHHVRSGLNDDPDALAITTALENTKIGKEGYAPDVFLFYGHGAKNDINGPVVSLMYGAPLGMGESVNVAEFKEAAKQCTGVVIIFGCASANMSSYFPNANVRLLLQHEAAEGEAEQLLEATITIIKEARGKPEYTWGDLTRDSRVSIPGWAWFSEEKALGVGAESPIWPSRGWS